MEDSEYKKCQEDTLYWYNTYIRKSDEPILDKQQWEDLKASWQSQRDKQDDAIFSQYRKHQLPNGGTFFSMNIKDES